MDDDKLKSTYHFLAKPAGKKWKKTKSAPLEELRAELIEARHGKDRRQDQKNLLLSDEQYLRLQQILKTSGSKDITDQSILLAMVEPKPRKAGKPTHAACAYLGAGKYRILSLDDTVHEWNQFRLLFSRYGFPISTVRLHTFKIESPKQLGMLRKHWNSSPVSGIEAEAAIPELVRDVAYTPKELDADQMWLVEYECRHDVIRVSPLGDGFFAPGQDPCWHFNGITRWIQQVKVPEKYQFGQKA